MIPFNWVALLSQETVVSERLQTGGPLGFIGAIVVSVVSIVLILVWLGRQRGLLGMPVTLFLGLLRVIVVLVAVWMVTQPAWTRTETMIRRAEIVVLADSSGSMDTVDAPDMPLIADWRSAIDDPEGALSQIQRAELDVRVAGEDPRMNASLIQRAIDTVERVGALESNGVGTPSGMDPLNRVDPAMVASCVRSLLSAVDSSEQWQDAADRSEQLAYAAARNESLADAMIDLETWRGRLQHGRLQHGRLHHGRLQTTADTVRASSMGAASVSPMSRKAYLSGLLNRFESELAKGADQAIVVRRATFADRVVVHDSGGASSQVPSWERWLMEDTSQASTDGQTGRTSISEALGYVRSISPSSSVSAVLMLTEGQHNASTRQSPVDVAASLIDTPIFTVAIGDRTRRRDLAIHRVKAPAMVFQEDRPVVEAVISSYECEGDEVIVTLSTEDRAISRQTIRFPSAMCDVAVRFELPSGSVGQKEYQLDVEALSDETSLQNNHAVITIQTIKSKLFVLIADQGPRWEHRYLEQLFRRDPRIELDKLLLLPRLKTTLPIDSKTGTPLPTTVDGWAKFDVVILGDLPPEIMTPEVCDAMSQWIKTGGNAIVIAGPQSMPAAYQSEPWFDLLPVTKKPLAASIDQWPRPTPAGQLHPAIELDRDPDQNQRLWQRWFSGPTPGYLSPFHAAKPTATVLASLGPQSEPGLESTGQSVGDSKGFGRSSATPAWLCVHRVGRGQVAYLSSPISYRLRIRQGDRYHHRFWGQMVRWMTTAELAKGDGLVDLQSDRPTYDEGQRPGIRVRLSDSRGIPVRGGEVQIELIAKMGRDPGGVKQTIPLVEDEQTAGVYEITLDRLPAGVYEVRPVGSTVDALRLSVQGQRDERGSDQVSSTTFTVEPSMDLERLMTEANPVLLKQISDASGGVSIPPSALEEILHVISLDPQVTENRHTTPLWNRWLYLWVIVGCLTIEWWIRRRRGLV